MFVKSAEDAGEDYEQLKLLDSCAQDLDRLERKRKKKNPDPGFSGDLSIHLSNHQSILSIHSSILDYHQSILSIHSSILDYHQAQYRQYERLTKQLKPDLEAYDKQKEEL